VKKAMLAQGHDEASIARIAAGDLSAPDSKAESQSGAGTVGTGTTEDGAAIDASGSGPRHATAEAGAGKPESGAERIPDYAQFSCGRCGNDYDSRQVQEWKQITGFVRRRDKGGTNHVVMRKETGHSVCAACMTLIQSGGSEQLTV
jgi:hypothetical protein